MYKINDYVMYKHDVCKIKDIKENKKSNSACYVLCPIDDVSLYIDTPTDNRMGYIKDLMTVEKANELIDNIPNIQIIDNFTDRNIENVYRDLFVNGGHTELIQIIKTSYTRNNEKINNNKKICDKDDRYFKLAEKCLYNELGIVLNKSFEETKEYVINRVTKASSNIKNNN